ncbi:hypothetical protein ACFWMG_25330 [Streptomyces sp. NPDC127074]|uniref:hypothetical protein n=1 Tax=Streptomyces sp. NPDC127074 TaxID=3347130 RepID=UPI0036562582
MLRKISVAVIVAAISTITVPAMAAETRVTGVTTIDCPASIWAGGDKICSMAYTGSKWYTGDWVALHLRTNDTMWVNGYTPNNVDYGVRVLNVVGSAASPWKRGGSGVGASAGDISVDVNNWGTLEYANGYSFSVYVGQ